MIRYGSDQHLDDVQIEYLSQHFSEPFMKLGFSPTRCRLEWGELKLLVKDYIKQNENDDFLTKWQSVVEYNDGADMKKGFGFSPNDASSPNAHSTH